MNEPTQLPVPKGAGVRVMFDGIAKRYDLLNRLLTLGLDEQWRRRAVRALQPHDGGRYLDLCAGTLDLTKHIVQQAPKAEVVAADYSAEMLERGRGAGKLPAGARVTIDVADATHLPYDAATFDGVICGFGMRNLADLDAGLAETARVLKAGGVLVVLEFFRPTTSWQNLLHKTVHRRIVPTVGRLVSGSKLAYDYLGASMESFESIDDFCRRARSFGLERQSVHTHFPGVASHVVFQRVP